MAIKLSYDMKVYREQLHEVLKDDDFVVELGCHVGKSTEVISNIAKNGHIIAIDNSPEAISIMEEFSNNHENVEFISGDVRLHDVLEKVTKDLIDYSKTKTDFIDKNSLCDVLSIDLGGGYHPDTVFKVFYIWSSTLKPRVTLIRNKGLIDFVNSIEHTEKIESEEGYLQSYENQGIPPQIKEFCLWSDSLKNKK